MALRCRKPGQARLRGMRAMRYGKISFMIPHIWPVSSHGEFGVNARYALMLALTILSSSLALRAETGSELNDQAVQLNDNGPKEEELYKAAIQQDPSLVEPRQNLALLYLATDRKEAAVLELQKALNKFPDDAQLHYLLGLAYATSGDLKEAAEAFTSCVKIKPEWPDPCYNLGLLYWNPGSEFGDLGSPLKAESFWKRALEASPEDVRAAEGLASLYTSQLKYQQTIGVLSKQDETKLSADALRNLSLCCKKLKKKDDAERYRRLAEARAEAGVSEAGKEPQAETQVAEAPAPSETPVGAAPVQPPPSEQPSSPPPAASPDGPEASKSYVEGLQAVKEGRFKDACDLLSQVAAQSPAYRDVQWYWASALLEMGKEGEAEPHLRLAIQQNEKHRNAYTALGVLLEKNKKNQEALEMYKKALEVAPESPYAPIAQEGIKRLEVANGS